MNQSSLSTPPLIRPEKASDYQQISMLLDDAFKGHAEAELVERIRSTLEYANDLTLVAVADEQIVGFIMLSAVSLHSPHGKQLVWSLGPVAVLTPRQSTGVGGALIREALSRTEKLDSPLVVLLGHANYYPRFGFEKASTYSVFPPVSWRDESYMIYRLPKWHAEVAGKIEYTPAWQIS